ncbi:hybrid sensor histidine kinase/response regulator transcription factor [Microbacter margulisiae]|uniref:histidine kinase n=1 Tax=Microbacter margulisiae TaxID=1350067 RepID=A0A7W5H284_9PORP|nr:hybrid sensor histidine kinase/response regulator transcription factor [Microbacter margulisiae]MBB3187369.1 ligand-binding sensor domain-containing protein/signal transduction histidine kinase/DNA-binding response OmpR family regulator [Microbacter margulisiae]
MNIKRSIYLLSLFLFFGCYMNGQPSPPLVIKKISTYQGLSNSSISAIVQDNNGFMWFATEDGLNRYDGYKFTVFRHDSHDPNSISDNFISDIYRQSDSNQLWVATNVGLDLYDYNNDRFIHFIHDVRNPFSIDNNQVTKIAKSNDGNLWIGTYGGGVSYFDMTSERFIHIVNVPGRDSFFNTGRVMALLEDSYGILWIGTQNKGLYAYDVRRHTVTCYKQSKQNTNTLPSNTVNVIFEDQNHNIWIGTDGGLSLFDRNSKKFITFVHHPNDLHSLISNIVRTIMQNREGVIWVGTQSGGISKFRFNANMIKHPNQAVFQNIYESDDETGLSYSTVQALYQDKDHNIWIGIYKGGINFISGIPDQFLKLEQNKNSANSLSYHKVWGICDDTQGNIWIGTDGGGINEYNPSAGKIKVFKHSDQDPRSLSDNAVLSAFKDHEGNLWFGTYRGGLNEDPISGGFIHYKNIPNDSTSLPNNDVRIIYEDAQHNLWIGTDGGGLSLFSKATHTFNNSIMRKWGLSGTSVRAMIQDKDGNYWIGTYNNGVYYVNRKSGKFVHFQYNTDAGVLASNTIFSIIQDQQGRIWIGTDGGGLFLYVPSLHGFINYDEKNGLANDNIKALLEDKSGNIWVSTNKGISCFSLAKHYFINYDIQDGIPGGEFAEGSALLSQGIMYFGNMYGLCYFDPEKVEKIVIQPVVHIVDFQLFNKSMPVQSDKFPDSPLSNNIINTREITLNYKQSFFTIVFSALNYRSPDKIQYAYMMKGLDNEWNYTGTQRMATYRNLNPGRYVFMVKATNIPKDWGSAYTSLVIRVLPPFWETWWAYLIYFLILAGIAFRIYKYYQHENLLKQNLLYEKITRQKEYQLNQEKLRFFTNITHEFRSPLTLIIGPLEDLLSDSKLAAPIVRKLMLIHRNSNQLLNLIDKLLEFRKVEAGEMKLRVVKDNITALLKEVYVSFVPLFEHKNIEFTIESCSDVVDLWYDPEKLVIILNNLLSNAYKYTHAGGKVSLELAYGTLNGNEAVLIKVRDTGIGISEEHKQNVFDQYYRIEEVKDAQGYGIGLALTQNLVSLMQGEISVESELGKGSCFTVTLLQGNSQFSREQIINDRGHYVIPANLPRSIENAEQATEMTDLMTYADAEQSGDGQKKIMLIVEDNDEIMSYIKDIFKKEFRMLEATDGEAGLKLALKHVPDIIITDIIMPKMNGMELCAKVKSELKTSHVPVVMLTALNTLQYKIEGYETGADSYITKPFSTALLTSRVYNLIKTRTLLAEHIARNLLFQPEEVQLGLKDEKFISDIIEIIEKNISDEKFDAIYLAGELNMSHSTLYRKLKALTGFSISEFIRGVRLKRAAQLLRSQSYNVSEVAYMVGFNDLKHFRTSFKEQYKVSPSDYMKTHTSIDDDVND